MTWNVRSELQCRGFRRETTHLPVRRHGIFTLLLEVFGVGVFSSPDSRLVYLNAGVAVFKHQPAVGGAFFSIFGKFCFIDRLHGKWAIVLRKGGKKSLALAKCSSLEMINERS